jgi:hypothetical protein
MILQAVLVGGLMGWDDSAYLVAVFGRCVEVFETAVLDYVGEFADLFFAADAFEHVDLEVGHGDGV